MHERTTEERVTRLEVELEHFVSAGETFRQETKAELADIRKATRTILLVTIIGLVSVVTLLLGWGLNLLFQKVSE